jgi:hypothetical protein
VASFAYNHEFSKLGSVPFYGLRVKAIEKTEYLSELAEHLVAKRE